MVKPVLLAVHDQPGDLRLIQQELTDRYARDYEIICTDSPASALDRLAALQAAPATAVLLLFAAAEMHTMGGVEFLRRAHDLHPHAQRVLLIPWSNRSASKPVLRLITEGRIDRYAVTPVRTPDESVPGSPAGCDGAGSTMSGSSYISVTRAPRCMVEATDGQDQHRLPAALLLGRRRRDRRPGRGGHIDHARLDNLGAAGVPQPPRSMSTLRTVQFPARRASLPLQPGPATGRPSTVSESDSPVTAVPAGETLDAYQRNHQPSPDEG